MTQARNLSRLLNKKLETYKFTATSGQTTFSDSDDAGLVMSYTPENMLVTYNGVVLENGTEYTATNGTSVVLDTGADSAAEVNVYAFESVSLGGYVPSTGGTFGGNVEVTGDLTVDTNTLFVDAANNRVGLGTSSPATRLDVNGDVTITDKIIHSGDTNTAIRFPANDTVTVETNGSEQLRVTSTGSVGIGNPDPATQFHVGAGAADTAITIQGSFVSATGDLFQLWSSGDAASLGLSSSFTSYSVFPSSYGYRMTSDPFSANFAGAVAGHQWAIYGSERMRIDSSGNVGIGTSSPSDKLDVRFSTNGYIFASNSADANTGVRFQNTGRDYAILCNGGAGASNSLRFYDFTAGADRMQIDSSGRVTMPFQPAFFARPPAGFTVGPDTTISGTWSVDTNIGNHFNSSGGIFTAPVAGIYNLIWSIFITDDAGRRDAYISVNGVIRVRSEINGYSTGGSNLNINAAVSTNIYLNANDAVTFGAYTASGSTYSTSAPWSYASGVLIS